MELTKQLASSDVLNADETGFRVEGKTQWLHMHSTSEWMLLHIENMGSYTHYAGYT